MLQRALATLLLIFLITLAARASGQDAAKPTAPPDGLPEAPGKAVLLRTCTACHGTDMIVDAPRTVPLWRDTLELMKNFGAEASDEDWKTIGDYLITQLAHLSVNKAPTEDVAQVFGIDQAMAQQVVEYRDKQGGFKTIDDLKKVPQLDAATVDALKARLIFN